MFHHELLLKVGCHCFKQTLFHLNLTDFLDVWKKGCLGTNWAHHTAPLVLESIASQPTLGIWGFYSDMGHVHILSTYGGLYL